MTLSKDRYIKKTKYTNEGVRSAAWGIRGIAKALTRHDLDCEVEESGRLSTQDTCDLHYAIYSLAQYIDENTQWIDSAQIKGGV